jgi:ribose/xylose/arabinose/galactoside ABC-type transport system permease subunit
VLVLLLVLCAISALQTRTFFTWNNLVHNLLTKAAYIGIIACGMTFVMIAGGFDLSVASNTAVCSVVAVLVLQGMVGHAAWVAIAVAVLVTAAAGTALGAANGAVVSYIGVNPFVTTLSTMLVFRGIALILTHGGQTLSVPLALEAAFRQIARGNVNVLGSGAYQLKVPILVFLGVFVVCLYVLRFTRFGHYVYAVGGNENAAWLAGINTSMVKAATYAICGLTCAFAAVLYTSMAHTAGAESFLGLELIVIASVIVGGTPLGGGRGGLFFTLIGLLLLQVIENLLRHFGIGEEFRNVMRGGIILVVATIDVLVRGTGKKGRP